MGSSFVAILILSDKMITIFINSENNKPSDPHRFVLNHTRKIKNQYLAVIPHYLLYIEKPKSHTKTKPNTSASTWKEKLDLSDKSYSVSDIQGLEYFIKLHEKVTHEIELYIHKIQKRITLKIRLNLELVAWGTMKLLGSTEKRQQWQQIKMAKIYLN